MRVRLRQKETGRIVTVEVVRENALHWYGVAVRAKHKAPLPYMKTLFERAEKKTKTK